MALKVDIWPPFPLETQTKCHLHGSLSGVSNAPPPLLWQPQTPRMASKDCVVCEKRGPTCPLFFKGPAKRTPTWACVCTKTPLHENEKVLHSSKYPLQTPAPKSRMPRVPRLSWRNLWRKKQNEHLEHPLKAGQLFSDDVFFPKRAVAGGIHILFFGEEFGFHKLCPTSAIFFPGFEKQSFVSLHRKQEIYNKQIKFHKLLWWPSIKHSGVQNWGSTLDTGITFEWPRKQLMKLAFLNLFWSSHTTRIGGSQSIWLLEPIFSEHQSTLFFYFLNNHEKPVSPIQLFRLSEYDDGSLPSSRIMTPGQRNPVSNSKEWQFYEFRLVLFVECMVPTLQRIIVGNILNNTSVSVKHTSQRSNQRHLCKNERRRRTTKFYEQTRFERTPESSTAECET